MLCTETQWLRACGSNVRIGNYQSWTASWQGEQVIVRGGKGCDDRQTVSGASRSAVRVALCCERAVGIKTDNRQLAFMKVAHADQLRYERAYNAGNTAELHALWYGSVEFDGTVQTKDRLRTKQEQWFRQHPKRWMLFDICEVKLGPVLTGLGKTLKSPGLIHDCSTVSVVGDLVTVVMTEFGRYRAEGDTANRVVQVKHHSRTRKLSKL
jgi:hypothetical protein